MKGFKGFNEDMTCRGMQYAENTEYEVQGEPELCDNGMHFCENPLDVLDHYPIVCEDGSFGTFAEVEALGDVKTDGKKSVTTKLRVGAKLSFPAFIKASVDFLIERTKIKVSDDAETENDGGISFAKIGSSGNCAKIGSSGDGAKIGSSGYGAKIGSSGNCAKIGSSGDGAKIGSSGNCAQIGSSGNCAKIGSSGDGAQIGSSGNCAQIGSSGNCAKIGSSGNCAKIGSSGDGAKIGSSGYDSVICCAGHGCIVKAKTGSWITLSEWKYYEEKDRYFPACVKTEFVDGVRIKGDTPYILKDGAFVEVNE